MKTQPLLIFIIFLSVFAFPGTAQTIEELEFINQPIRDVLLVMAELGNLSIVPDETVTGTTSNYFSDVSVQEAIETIIGPNNLYMSERNGVLYVSRIRIEINDEGLVSLDAEDVSLQQLTRRLSREAGITILNDSLPNDRIDVHIQDLRLSRVLEILTTRFPNLEVVAEEDLFYVKNIAQQSSAASRGNASRFTVSEGLYSIDVRNVRVSELLEGLFSAEGNEYALLKRGDEVLERFSFSGKSFQEMLELILQLSDADYTMDEGIYYIYEISRNDILKSFDTVIRISLDYIPVNQLTGLFPTGFISSSNFKVDRVSNSIILNGSSSELGPVIEFIETIDQPMADKQWRRFDLAHSTVEDMIAIIPEHYKSSEPIPVRDTGSFLMLLSQAQSEQLQEFIALADNRERGIPVDLRFIQAQQLLENLPPSIDGEAISETSDPRRVFFKGSQAAYELFMSELDFIDRPVPQIRYEIIVIQQSEGSSLDYSGVNFANSRAVEGDESSFLGALGNIMSLNFDIVSNFGYIFALDLNFKLSNQEASILADTTLNALSGQEVNFENTQTYRYQETEIDPDTGDVVPSGVTREITSGLFINISGWVSGDGMITMDVSSTISKQGAASGSNLPTTSQRVIDTHVRTQSGKPVIIGGLIQQEENLSSSRIPGLSDIPLAGEAFTGRDQSRENTEMIVYIIPHIEYPYYESNSLSDIFEALYERHGNEKNSGL
jgi:general secretion pathway protein D